MKIHLRCPFRRLFVPFSALTAAIALCSQAAAREPGFTSLFDGKTLNGWRLVNGKGGGYGVTNGVLFCARGGGGNLYTEGEYSDFILRLEFKLEDGSNNGVGIRAPLEGDAAYAGMEIQILEEGAALRGKWGKLREEQYHGSVYDCIAARKGALKKPGEWNTEEIVARGRHIIVTVNGKTILDADLNSVTDPAKIMKHPGLFRDRGHIGFLGHNDYIEFRNIRIKELPKVERDNTLPEEFQTPGQDSVVKGAMLLRQRPRSSSVFHLAFNGSNLNGWKGLMKPPLDNPIKRAALNPTERVAAQKEADADMRAHWKVEDGVIVFDGKGRSLCTTKDYANFEMLVDWKLPPQGDSGIYLRGSPQVQIWDPYTKPTKHGSEVGSGAFYNNQKNPSKPLKVADKPIGEWNRFRIIMAGERVHVFLNGELVTRDVVMENYWDRTQPIFPSGQIELQNHGDKLWFKNIYIREIPSPSK